MLLLVGVWLKGLRTSSESRQWPCEAHTLKRQGEEQAAKVNIGSCCLQNWKDNGIKDQQPLPHADQMHTCKLLLPAVRPRSTVVC